MSGKLRHGDTDDMDSVSSVSPMELSIIARSLSPVIRDSQFREAPMRDTLKSRQDIGRVLSEGMRRRGAALDICCQRAEHVRMAVLVGRRHGSAVRRNRIKRWLREIWRKERPYLAGKWEVVILPQKIEDDVPFLELAEELSRLLSAAGLREGGPRSILY